MLETPHVAVGAALAIKIGNPALSIPLSLASHFILDRIPHWNPSFFTETKTHGRPKTNSVCFSGIESLVALFLGLALAYQALPNWGLAITVIVCSFASVASDVIKIPFFFFRSKNKWLERWVIFERSLQVETENIFLGLLTQVLVIGASLYWIFT